MIAPKTNKTADKVSKISMPSRVLAYGGTLLAILVIAVVLLKSNSSRTVEQFDVKSPTKLIQSPKAQSKVEIAVVAQETKEEVDPKKLPDSNYKKILNPKLPPKKYIPTVEEVEQARLGPDGKPRKVSIYKTPAEQAMGAIFSTELGSPPPLLPSIPKCTSEEQLQEFLQRTFAYDKDVPQPVNENRILLQQVQAELREYLSAGGDIGGFIDFYVGELKACNEQWKTAQRMLVDMARSGEDAQSLRQFRDAANDLLARKGIKALTYPPSVRAAMGEE